jgi:hypothetical protein
MSEALLMTGMVAAVVFVAVLLFEGARRPGYSPIYHTGSALSLGARGWIQTASAAGLVLLIATAVAWQKDAKYTGLVQRALILVYCSWIVLLGLHLL